MSIENRNPLETSVTSASASDPIVLFPLNLQSMREHLDALRAMRGDANAASDVAEPKPTGEPPPHMPREAPAQQGDSAVQVGGQRREQPQNPPPGDRPLPPKNDGPREGANGRVVVDTAYRSNKIFQTIVKEGNFGNADLQDRFRGVFLDELTNNPGQDRTTVLQRLVDQTNARFENNNRDGMIARNNLGPHAPSQYYLGLQDANTIILYSPDGIRTLDLRPR